MANINAFVKSFDCAKIFPMLRQTLRVAEHESDLRIWVRPPVSGLLTLLCRKINQKHSICFESRTLTDRLRILTRYPHPPNITYVRFWAHLLITFSIATQVSFPLRPFLKTGWRTVYKNDVKEWSHFAMCLAVVFISSSADFDNFVVRTIQACKLIHAHKL